MSPLMIPHVVLGIAFLRFFTQIGLGNTFLGLVLAHIVIVLPFALRLTLASAIGMDRAIEQAAVSLGASDWVVFRRVTLPLIMPGLMSGWALAFIQSFDEVTMTVFIAAPGTETLPVRMFLYIQDNIDPLVTSVSAVVIALTTIAPDRARPRLRPRPAADRAGQRGGVMAERMQRRFRCRRDRRRPGRLVARARPCPGSASAWRCSTRATRPCAPRAPTSRWCGCRARAWACPSMPAGPSAHPTPGRASLQRLKEETGLDVAFERPGGFHLALSEAELEARATLLKRLHNQPGIATYQTEIVDRSARRAHACRASGPTWSAAATARSTGTAIRCGCTARCTWRSRSTACAICRAIASTPSSTAAASSGCVTAARQDRRRQGRDRRRQRLA